MFLVQSAQQQHQQQLSQPATENINKKKLKLIYQQNTQKAIKSRNVYSNANITDDFLLQRLHAIPFSPIQFINFLISN